jgi:L-2-hydroxyglutarate oxidase
LGDDGKLIDDFHIVQSSNSLNVCNAPSPAATACLEIGKYICEKVPDLQRVTKGQGATQQVSLAQ